MRRRRRLSSTLMRTNITAAPRADPEQGTFATQVRDLLHGGGHRGCFQRFGDGRIRTRAIGAATAKAMQLDGGVDASRLATYRKVGPASECPKYTIPGCRGQMPDATGAGELDGFVECFVAGLIALQP
jgi:hypothetical protein